MRTLVIAQLTFFEAARRRILLAGFVIGVLFLVVFGLGMDAILADLASQRGASLVLRQEIINFLTMAGLYVVNFLTIMLSVLTSVDTLSGEITSGTIQTIATRPLRRLEVVAGKWLGFALLLAGYVLLLGGGVAAISSWLGGYQLPNVWYGLSTLWLNALIMLSVSLFGGAFLSTLANGVLVFGLFGVAFVGGWIEQIGSVLGNETAVQIGIVTSLVMPSEALWRRAAFLMQSSVTASIGFSPFTAGAAAPSELMVWYAVAFMLVILAWGMQLFAKRDL